MSPVIISRVSIFQIEGPQAPNEEEACPKSNSNTTYSPYYQATLVHGSPKRNTD